MLKVLGRILYGLSASSVILSLVIWLQRQRRPSGLGAILWREDPGGFERTGIFVGLWAPTLAVAGKVLEDMSDKAQMLGGSSTSQTSGTTSASANGRVSESDKTSILR